MFFVVVVAFVHGDKTRIWVPWRRPWFWICEWVWHLGPRCWAWHLSLHRQDYTLHHWELTRCQVLLGVNLVIECLEASMESNLMQTWARNLDIWEHTWSLSPQIVTWHLEGSVLALSLILLSLHKETVSFHTKDQEQVVNMKLSFLSSPMYLFLFLGFSLSPLPGIHNSCQAIFVRG